jgi:Cobalamin synthesis protein cobW C-terminal domain
MSPSEMLADRRWMPTRGDRRQEIVFIGGPDMDETAFRATLDVCPVGSVTTGMSKSNLNRLEPFPAQDQEKAT